MKWGMQEKVQKASLKAAEIARAENQKRESEHQQQRHHDLNQNKSIRRHIIWDNLLIYKLLLLS